MATATEGAETVPWVEKYRPARMDDVVHQEEAVATLRKAVATLSLPHLLFYGTPGTGKTSTILAVARELYGTPELLRERVLELNASDERGIDVIRHKVKEFAMCAAAATTTSGADGKRQRVPGFKVVVLDEADAMTPDAQNALRRTMEVYSGSTRFCLICNFISRIIEPLASRCAKFRFRPIPVPVVVARLRAVADAEHFPATDDALEEVARVSCGDLRRAIMTLQSLHAAVGGDAAALTPETVRELSGVVPQEVLAGFLAACESNSFEQLERAARAIEHGGYAADQFLSQLHDMLLLADSDGGCCQSLDDYQRGLVIDAIGAADKCLIDGADEYLQIFALGSRLMKLLCSARQ